MRINHWDWKYNYLCTIFVTELVFVASFASFPSVIWERIWDENGLMTPLIYLYTKKKYWKIKIKTKQKKNEVKNYVNKPKPANHSKQFFIIISIFFFLFSLHYHCYPFSYPSHNLFSFSISGYEGIFRTKCSPPLVFAFLFFFFSSTILLLVLFRFIIYEPMLCDIHQLQMISWQHIRFY